MSGDLEMLPLNTWLMPESKCQPGFDAVMLLSNGTIRFVQMTVALSRDLYMGVLGDFAKRLLSADYRVLKAEVYIVIPDTAHQFRISQLIEWKRFTDLFTSWPQTLEGVEKNIKIVTAVQYSMS